MLSFSLWLVMLFLLLQCSHVAARWLHNTVSMNLTSDVTPAQALALYSELDQQPTWSPWLKSCNVIDKNTGLSTWTIGALGLFYTWKAVKSPICETSYQHSICWESIDGMYLSSHKFIHTHSHILLYTGLPNKGRAVFFIDHQSGENKMDLTVMYDLHLWIGVGL